jgi:hypothetical protein
LCLFNFGIAQKGVKGGHPSDAEALPSIQKSQAEKVGSNKAIGRPETKIQDRDFPPFALALPDELICIFDGLLDLVVETNHGEMQDIPTQFSFFSIDEQFAMRVYAAPMCVAALPES